MTAATVRRHADDCTNPDHAELDCTADELTLPLGPGDDGDCYVFRSTTPDGERRVVIHAEATLCAATLGVLIGHLQRVR